MLNDWRKRRRLLREIEQLDRQLTPSLANDDEAMQRVKFERRQRILGIQYLETAKLKRAMQSFGIGHSFTSGWKLDVRSEQFYLDEDAIAQGWKLVSEARFAWWKKWVDILSPIIATILSIIALIVSIIAINKP